MLELKFAIYHMWGFCALVNGIECCKMEEIVDVFETVKALCSQKPGSVQLDIRRSLYQPQNHCGCY